MTQMNLSNQKSWIKHYDAVLILNGSEDPLFLEKKEACHIVNDFLAEMTGTTIPRFEE